MRPFEKEIGKIVYRHFALCQWVVWVFGSDIKTVTITTLINYGGISYTVAEKQFTMLLLYAMQNVQNLMLRFFKI